ncbi:MAG: 3-oxoacyl-ACP reductase FabG [Deltaproteobacteria bacterium]|nr:3-oxoacyl-ACP reductase FabG [Deltaproteobacteria bacterium]
MKIDLRGKTAIVTGAAGNGLGRADALALGHAGCKVAVIDVADMSQTMSVLKNEDITARAYTCDISNHELVEKTVEQIVTDLGGADVLVNNASILTTVGMFGDIPVEKWNRDIQVNLIGSANMSRAVWPHMHKHKWGRIIFMSSVAGTRGGAGQTSYASTKAGVIGLAKSLAIEGARANITANIIAPGVMETDAAMTFIRGDMLDRMKKSIPMRKFGRPEDIANAITFLCSDQANYITGQVLEVDGGSGLFVF